MEKIHLYYLLSFSGLNQFYTSPYYDVIKNISKKLGVIKFINTDYLTKCKSNKIIKNKKVIKNKNKLFIFEEPKNFHELNKIFLYKRNLIINSLPRKFSFFFLHRYFKIKGIPFVEIANLGNVQKGTHEFIKSHDLKFINFFVKNFIIKKIFNILALLNIVSKVDVRFVSNEKNFLSFKTRNIFKEKMSYYKKLVYVKSAMFEISHKNVEEKYIVLLDQYPFYKQFTDYMFVNKEHVNEHYKKLNNLLDKLYISYKKDIIICIHPSYPLNFYAKYFKNKKIFKYRTHEFILKSFIVLGFNSSVIANAIKLNKKILLIEAEIFKGKHYSSYIYEKAANLNTIKLDYTYNFNKNHFLEKLDAATKEYYQFNKNYLGVMNKNKSSVDISNYILENY